MGASRGRPREGRQQDPSKALGLTRVAFSVLVRSQPDRALSNGDFLNNRRKVKRAAKVSPASRHLAAKHNRQSEGPRRCAAADACANQAPRAAPAVSKTRSHPAAEDSPIIWPAYS